MELAPSLQKVSLPLCPEAVPRATRWAGGGGALGQPSPTPRSHLRRGANWCEACEAGPLNRT